MARNVSTTALQAMLSQETGEIFLVTLKIEHADITTLRFVNDTEDLSRSDGNYIAYPFEIRLPEDSEDNVPRMQIAIDNVDRQIIQEIRQLSSQPTITINIVLKSSPDTVEAGPFVMNLKQVDYNELTISGQIGYQEDFLNEQFPKLSFTPENAQGLF